MRLLFYYLKIILPLVILFTLLHLELITGFPFLFLLIFYVFVYRTYVDAKKLVDQNVIPKKDMWKLVIPFRRVRYFKQLYFTL